METLDIVDKLAVARQTREPIPAFTETAPLELEQAFAAQFAGLERRLAEGDSLCGYKMGLTSRAKQRDVGVESPIFGSLLHSMELDPSQPVDLSSFIHPRVEPEIAVVLKHRLRGPVTRTRDVLAALDGAYLGYELLDSRYREYRFALPDVIADNTSAAGFCLGHVDVLSHWGRIGLEGIVVRKNGEVVQTGVPAASLGDPIFAVMRLANELARFGRWLEPGMVILTGGVTQSVPIAPGDEFEMSWRFERIRVSTT